MILHIWLSFFCLFTEVKEDIGEGWLQDSFSCVKQWEASQEGTLDGEHVCVLVDDTVGHVP